MRQRVIACALVAATALATAALASETITYVYDAKGRLIEVKRSGTVNDKVKTVYTYDRVHNRTRVTTTLPPP
jgi:YD repeat-containing protein